MWFWPAIRLLNRFEPAIVYYESWGRCHAWCPKQSYTICKERVDAMLEQTYLEGTHWNVERVEAVLPAGL